jgi:hypothetical protein
VGDNAELMMVKNLYFFAVNRQNILALQSCEDAAYRFDREA